MDKTIFLAATVDERYVTPLAVTLRSACRRLSKSWKLRVFVIGYQIGAGARDEMEQRLAGSPVDIEWLSFDLERVRGAWPGTGQAGGITLYYRLFLGEALPASVKRVIFLDADVLVEGDLAELWVSPFDGMTVQATPDAYAHVYHLFRLQRISFADGFRFTPDSAYFNAGVLLIDLVQWRREEVGRKAERILWEHGDKLAFRDQDALNCVLAGRWKRLPITWNFHELPKRLGFWKSNEPRDELKLTFRHPKIIHFIGDNPWEADCLNRYRGRWRTVAEEMGIERKRPPRVRRALFDLFQATPADFDWRIWRGFIQSQDPWQWKQASYLLLTRPWLLVTYPIWKASVRGFRWWQRIRPGTNRDRSSAS